MAKTTTPIVGFPSNLRLAAALFPEGNGSRIRVEFELKGDRRITCTVTNVNTAQGQLLVSGSYADDNGKMIGFYTADLLGKMFIS